MITAKIDASGAIAHFRNFIPVSVRNNLRKVIPGLTKRLGDAVESNLNTGLKSRTSLTVRKEMVEDASGVTGRVTTESSKNPLLPLWLESGTKPHVIAARNAPVLSFYWEKIGRQAFFPKVNHPGFPGIQYTARAFSDMQNEIVRDINSAVEDGLGARRGSLSWWLFR